MNMKRPQSKPASLFCWPNLFSDEINQSLQSVSQSQNINQDNIKKKTEEVKRQYDLVLADKIKLQNEINELKNLQFDDNKQ